MRSFWAKYNFFELKKYRGVIFHETEEGCKVWRGIDLSFQYWHKEFDKLWPEHLKVSKNLHFNKLLLSKVYIVWAKKSTGVIFHETEEGCKIWRGIGLWFQDWHKEFDKFWPEHSKVSRIFTLMDSFWAKYILFELKKYRGGIFHDIKEWCKTWRKTDLLLGKWLWNLANFDQTAQKCQN